MFFPLNDKTLNLTWFQKNLFTKTQAHDQPSSRRAHREFSSFLEPFKHS